MKKKTTISPSLKDEVMIMNAFDNMQDLLSQQWEKELCLGALTEAVIWSLNVSPTLYHV